jgi:hypothetical protein
VVLAALPLSPSGKVDRRALPAPQTVELAYVAPRSGLERIVADVWKEVLHVNRVGINDNIFELGAHSMLLAQVREKLRLALGRDITLLSFLQHPTVSSLCEQLVVDTSPYHREQRQPPNDRDLEPMNTGSR